MKYIEGRYYFRTVSGIVVSQGNWAPDIFGPSSAVTWKGEELSLTLEVEGVYDSLHALALPEWLAFDAETGTLSGLPPVAGAANAVVVADGEWGPSEVFTVHITVRDQAEAAPRFGEVRNFFAEKNIEISESLEIFGDLDEAEFSVTGLPAGIVFIEDDFQFSGTLEETGVFPITVEVSNSHGVATAEFYLYGIDAFDERPALGASAARGVVSYPFLYAPVFSGGADQFEALGLPQGLEIDSTTGEISGVPEKAGSHTVSILGETDEGTGWLEFDLEVTYLAPTVISWPSDVRADIGDAIDFEVRALGSELEFRWKKDGTSMVDNGYFTGSKTPHLEIDSVMSGDVGEYRVVLFNDNGFLTSPAARLRVSEAFATWAERVLGDDQADPSEDSLEVGIPDLLWYALGAETGDRPLLPQMADAGEWLEFRFHQNLAAEDVDVMVEESTDLFEWWLTSVPSERVNGSGSSEYWRIRVSPTEEPRFFRLRIEGN